MSRDEAAARAALTAAEKKVIERLQKGWTCSCRLGDPRSYVEMRGDDSPYPVRVGRSLLARLVKFDVLSKEMSDQRMTWTLEPEPVDELPGGAVPCEDLQPV